MLLNQKLKLLGFPIIAVVTIIFPKKMWVSIPYMQTPSKKTLQYFQLKVRHGNNDISDKNKSHKNTQILVIQRIRVVFWKFIFQILQIEENKIKTS